MTFYMVIQGLRVSWIALVPANMSCEIVVQDFSDDKCPKLHLLPCTIDYNGEANISSYFETTVRKGEESK